MKTEFTVSRRRGALLLLVLGVLTLFVLAGTVMLTLATRARTSSRAFSAATGGTAAGPMLARIQLEQALLQLIRGGPRAKAAGLSESLLEDMYGSKPPLVATVTALHDNGVLLETEITVSGSAAPPIRASDLCGRIITFTPAPTSGDSASSLRILRASASTSGTGAFTCWMAKVHAQPGRSLPKAPCPALVNQPAFRAEAYDAFDAANTWLTQTELQDGVVAAVPRPAFGDSAGSASVDNDNDGVNDGVWLSGLLDNRTSPDGSTLAFDVSYLVLDLDGRINVNAHGNRTSLDFPASSTAWKTAPAVPTGSGYGPADVDASLLFVDPLAQNKTQSDPPAASDRWRRLIGESGTGGLTAVISSTSQRRPVPQVGEIDGRYGLVALAGGTGNDPLSARSELLYGNNPLVDLKCMIRMQLDTTSNSTSAVPKMIYFCPDWTKAGFVDDPYEMRLDVDAQRPAALRSGTTQIDNPFTLAELESVLRQFDDDAPTLPPRLSVALDNASQRSRMLVTTESCDTPGLTGTTAATIESYVAGLQCDPAAVMSPDVLAGMRFDINRPFPAGATEAAAKADFCKHLYMLLVALGQPPNKDTAQWAANVVDYRDADSKFTRFQFDTSPADGWNPSPTDVVWGVERPELVIAQTLAWFEQNGPAGELFVSLHHPWSAVTVGPDGKEAAVDVLDPPLAAKSDANTMDLSKKSGDDPIWRLRFDEDKKFVLFYPETGGTPRTGADKPFPQGSVFFRSNDKSLLPPNSYLVVKPNGNSLQGIKVDSGLNTFGITKGGTFRAERWSGAGNDQPGSDTMVFLDRLADPSVAWDATTNPYVTVDQLGIKIVNRTGLDPNNWRGFFRDPPFWRHRPFNKIIRPPTITALDPQATNWLPWANRAYISHAELMLVPRGNAIQMMTDYDIPKNKKASNPFYFLPTEKLLDAAIVPSRFAGAQASVSAAALTPVAMDKIPFNQISRWSEPGRVNLNTVIRNRNCSDPQANDAVWWATIGPDAVVPIDAMSGTNSRPGQAVPATSRVIDDGDAGFSAAGTWLQTPGGYGSDSREAAGVRSTTPNATATWNFTGLAPGFYRVAVTWSASSRLGSRCPYSIIDKSGTTSLQVDQQKAPQDFQADGASWAMLGTFGVSANGQLTVQLANNKVGGGETVAADAIRVEQLESITGGVAKSIREMLTLMQEDAIYIDSAAAAGVKGNSWKKNRPYDLNPAAAYATAIRLANVATIRSHVFAVWLTLRVKTTPGGATSYHRLFAIIDRSRPVGYSAGQDLNVRDTIRVLRFLE